MKKLVLLAIVVILLLATQGADANAAAIAEFIGGGMVRAAEGAATSLIRTMDTVGKDLYGVISKVQTSSSKMVITSGRTIGKSNVYGAVKQGTKNVANKAWDTFKAVPGSVNQKLTKEQITGQRIAYDKTEIAIEGYKATSGVISTASGVVWAIGLFFIGFVANTCMPCAKNLNRCGRRVAKWQDNKRDEILGDVSKWTFLNPMLYVLLVVGIFFALCRGLVNVVDFFIRHVYILLALFFLMAIAMLIQHYSTPTLNAVHNGVLLGQKSINTLSGVMNTGKKAMNIMIPITNERTYSAIQAGRVVYNAFIPEDVQVPMFSCQQSGQQQQGRRLTIVDEDGHTQLFDLSRQSTALRQIVVPVTLMMSLFDRFENMMLEFQLMLMAAFIEPILFVVSLILPKVTCAFSGGPVCIIMEIGDIVVTLFVSRLYLILRLIPFLSNLQTPQIHIGCKQGEFPIEMDANLCGGYIWDLEPKGAFFSELIPSTVAQDPSTDHSAQASQIMDKYLANGGQGRRLREQDPIWVNCTKSTHDGVYLETFTSGRVLHKAHNNGCPHVRDLILKTPHERILQFHRLNILDECVDVCLDGLVHLRSCFYSVDDHPIYVMGWCHHSASLGINNTVVDATLQRLFRVYVDLSYDRPTPPTDEQQQEETVEQRNLRGKRTTPLTRQETIDVIRKTSRGANILMADQVNCDLSHSDTKDPEDQFLNTLCLTSSYIQKVSFESLGPDSTTVHQFFDPSRSLSGPTYDRRHLEQQQRTQDIFTRFTKRLHASSSRMVRFTETIRKNIRLLTTATEVNDTTFTHRVLSMIADDQRENVLYASVLKSIHAFEAFAADDGDQTEFGRKRRDLATTVDDNPTYIEVIGDCPSDMYLCSDGIHCVAPEDMELCLQYEQPADANLFQRAAATLESYAATSFDFKGAAADVVQCWCGYDTKPDTLPLSTSNLQLPEGASTTEEYCLPLRAPYTYFADPIPETGIRSYVASLCNGTGLETSACYCYWYQPTALSSNVYLSGIFKMYVVNHIINALLDVQSFVYIFLTGPQAWFYFVQLIWQNVMWMFCGDRCPLWLIYMFGDLGYPDLTTDRRFLCAGLHAGSFFYTVFMVFAILMILIFVFPAVLFLIEFISPTFHQYRPRQRRRKTIKRSR
jgi:hypothetical protein